MIYSCHNSRTCEYEYHYSYNHVIRTNQLDYIHVCANYQYCELSGDINSWKISSVSHLVLTSHCTLVTIYNCIYIKHGSYT